MAVAALPPKVAAVLGAGYARREEVQGTRWMEGSGRESHWNVMGNRVEAGPSYKQWPEAKHVRKFADPKMVSRLCVTSPGACPWATC